MMLSGGHPELLRFARFIAVGGANTVLTFAVFVLLTGAGMVPMVSTVLAFVVGAVNSYLLNRRWTFDHAHGGLSIGARYAVVQVCGLGLNAAGVAFAVSAAGLAPTAGELVILPLVTASTFLLSRGWVFRAPRAG